MHEHHDLSLKGIQVCKLVGCLFKSSGPCVCMDDTVHRFCMPIGGAVVWTTWRPASMVQMHCSGLELMENDFVVIFHWPNSVGSDMTLVVERLELTGDTNIRILKIRAEAMLTNILGGG